MKIQAIIFDAGGTLIEPWPSVGHIYAEAANRHGGKVNPDEFESAIYLSLAEAKELRLFVQSLSGASG